MLRELNVVEQRYRAVLEVLDGIPVTEVPERFGVARQTVHRWVSRYRDLGLLLRPALTLAARIEREHQRPAPPVPAQVRQGPARHEQADRPTGVDGRVGADIRVS
jgi:transposase-like protein